MRKTKTRFVVIFCSLKMKQVVRSSKR